MAHIRASFLAALMASGVIVMVSTASAHPLASLTERQYFEVLETEGPHQEVPTVTPNKNLPSLARPWPELWREELTLRDLTALESTPILDGSLLREEDVHALNDLASTLMPVGLTEILFCVLLGVLRITHCTLHQMLWVYKTRLISLAPLFRAVIGLLVQRVIQGKSYKADSSSTDLLINLFGGSPCTNAAAENHLRAELAPIKPNQHEWNVRLEGKERDLAVPGNVTPSHLGAQQVEAMLVFSSPRVLEHPTSGQRCKLRQLQNHDLEMRSLNRMLGSGLHAVAAAQWPVDIELALSRVSHSARVVVLSGHWYGKYWVGETEKREAQLVSGEQFGKLLAATNKVPQLMLLNGCMSFEFGLALMTQLRALGCVCPATGIFLVCCTSKLHDKFAAEFCQELCSRATANAANQFQATSAREAFEQSCDVFGPNSRNKFKIGDPAQYLHDNHSTREHPYDPTCVGCNPPVHGVFRLLALSTTNGTITQTDYKCNDSLANHLASSSDRGNIIPSNCALVDTSDQFDAN